MDKNYRNYDALLRIMRSRKKSKPVTGEFKCIVCGQGADRLGKSNLARCNCCNKTFLLLGGI